MKANKMINVPLREYEEMVRDSEKLRVITEMAIRAKRNAGRGIGLSLNDVLLISGYYIPDKDNHSVCNRNDFSDKPVAPAQKICPHKTDSVSLDPTTISGALKEAFIDGAFPEGIAVELKTQIREKRMGPQTTQSNEVSHPGPRTKEYNPNTHLGKS